MAYLRLLSEFYNYCCCRCIKQYHNEIQLDNSSHGIDRQSFVQPVPSYRDIDQNISNNDHSSETKPTYRKPYQQEMPKNGHYSVAKKSCRKLDQPKISPINNLIKSDKTGSIHQPKILRDSCYKGKSKIERVCNFNESIKNEKQIIKTERDSKANPQLNNHSNQILKPKNDLTGTLSINPTIPLPFMHITQIENRKSIESPFESSSKSIETILVNKNQKFGMIIDKIVSEDEVPKEFERSSSIYLKIICKNCKSESVNAYGLLCDHNVCQDCLDFHCGMQISDFLKRYKSRKDLKFNYVCPVEGCKSVISVPTHMIFQNIKRKLLNKDTQKKYLQFSYFVNDERMIEYISILDGMMF